MQHRGYIFVVLFSWLFAFSISATAQIPPAKDSNRWEPAIEAYEKSDKTNQPPSGGIVFIGSSSIRGWKNLAQDFPEHKVINRGFGGSQIEDSVKYVERIVLPYRPKMVVLYAGDNDLNAGKTPQQLLEDFKQFVAKIHNTLPKTKIAFIAVKPSPSRWKLKEQVIETNELIKRYCEKNSRLSFIDIYTPMIGSDGQPRPDLFVKDNLHLNEEGYAVWTAAVKPHLQATRPAPSHRR